MHLNKILISCFLSIYFIVVVWHGAVHLDTDFGWHLQMGKTILKSGIPATDPFSYTMPEYPYIDHAWLTDTVIAMLYPYISVWGVSSLFALIVLSPLIIQSYLYKGRFLLSLILLEAGALVWFAGIRTQLIDWILFQTLLLLIPYKSRHLFIPFLFALWVNLHGGFALGIGFLLLSYAFDFVTIKRIPIRHIYIISLSVLATFINPYGIRIWNEIYIHLNSEPLHRLVHEWYPASDYSNLPLWLFCLFSLFLVVHNKKFLSGKELFLFTILFIFGLSAIRNMPFFFIYAFPLVLRLSSDIRPIIRRFIFASSILLVPIQIYTDVHTKIQYPDHAIAYIKQHTSEGNIFSVYNWGGYLIWHLPEKKVFIDGRMPTWQSPGKNILTEYENILNGNISLEQTLKKYHISTLILPAASGISNAEIVKNQAEKKMKRVYEDTTAVIYYTNK